MHLFAFTRRRMPPLMIATSAKGQHQVQRRDPEHREVAGAAAIRAKFAAVDRRSDSARGHAQVGSGLVDVEPGLAGRVRNDSRPLIFRGGSRVRRRSAVVHEGYYEM